MRPIWAITLVFTATGSAAAQGYYPQMPMYGRPLPYGYAQPLYMPAPAQPKLPQATNSRMPQLTPYPVIDTPMAPYTARALPTDTAVADENQPPAAAATASDQIPKEAPEEKRDANLDDLPPPPPGNDSPPGEPDPAAADVDVIKPRPAAPGEMPEPKPGPAAENSPENAAPTPDAHGAMPGVPTAAIMAPAPTIAAAPMVVVQQPRPTLLGHFFHLEQMHQLVNYSVPVHYPKTQVRGPWCYGDAYFSFFIAKRQDPPVILTTPSGTPVVGGGTLQFDNGERLGGRFTLGHWLNYAQTCALEFSFMGYFDREPSFFGTNLQRPEILFDVTTARITALSRFYTADVNYRQEICRGCFGHLDCLTGIRYLNLVETFNMLTTGLFSQDEFRTENTVIAGQVGLQGELNWGWCSLGFFGKAGLGNVHQRIIINEINGTIEPLGTGTFRRDRFGMVLEAGLFGGVQLSNLVRLSGGYTFTYVTPVARPSDQIDNDVTTFEIGDSDFWVQGFHAGLEFRF